MTYAPRTLSDARAYIIREYGVPANAVGIVGDSNHWGGYHCGEDRVVSGDYSVVESSRDRSGLTDASAGLDIGTFSKRIDGRALNLAHFSRWLVAECKAGAPDTRDIREVIYSPDGRTVKRWDRLGRRTSGDNSHLWHTHISYFRDSESRDKTALFRRYIGQEDDDMIGLKLGDTGERVKHLQGMLRNAGHDPGSVDGVYGAQTAKAVLAMRKAQGSGVDSGDEISGWAATQLHTALAKAHGGGARGPEGPAGKDGRDGKDGVDGKTPTRIAISGDVIEAV